jgi:transcriptional regulator with XRE-family HTH domain
MATKLRKWREANGLIQPEVAWLTGYSVPMISLLESGERDLKPLAKIRFARRLGVPPSELFDIEPEPEAAMG